MTLTKTEREQLHVIRDALGTAVPVTITAGHRHKMVRWSGGMVALAGSPRNGRYLQNLAARVKRAAVQKGS